MRVQYGILKVIYISTGVQPELASVVGHIMEEKGKLEDVFQQVLIHAQVVTLPNVFNRRLV